jgi:isoleucyl-tRNA synthetase
MDDLADIFVVSSVTLGSSGEATPDTITSAEWQYSEEYELSNGEKGKIHVFSPQASKCPRCWRYVVPEEEAAQEKVCNRCTNVVRELDGSA